jgi:hypothetical protein
MTIVKSEIGRRSANDTRFIVPPQPGLQRSDSWPRLDGSNKDDGDIKKKSGSYSLTSSQSSKSTISSGEQSLDGEPSSQGRGSADPDNASWQAISTFSIKFKFSF